MGEALKIEKLLRHIGNNASLIHYLIEHREREVFISEVEEYASLERLKLLEHFGIIELADETLSLDNRVTLFVESYLDIDENIEIAVVTEKINGLKHKIEIAIEFKQKQKIEIIKIKSELRKIYHILLGNLLKLRIHIDRVYKNTEEFSLKLKELHYYKEKLNEFTLALEQFETFLHTHKATMHNFYDEELNRLLHSLEIKKLDLNKTLIPLTRDVIEFINQVSRQNFVVDKVIKLKELKESFEIKSATDIEDKAELFEMMDKSVTIRTILDEEIKEQPSFVSILSKISSKVNIKQKRANSINFIEEKRVYEYIDVVGLNLEFRSSSYHLIEFLLSHAKMQNKPIDTIAQTYCKMILLYEESYNIASEVYSYQQRTFKKVYYDNAS